MSAPELPESVADELAASGPRFVNWRWEQRSGTPTKPPLTPSGLYASTTDPTTWTTLAEAQAAVGNGHDIVGIGFVLDAATDGIVGIDLDGCRNPETGEIALWAAKTITRLRSYAEVSPSGTGVKILAKADPVPRLAANKRTLGKANGAKPPAVEIYTTGRYFCLTGQILDGVPDEIVDATEALERLAAWVGKAKPAAEQPAPFLALLERDSSLRDAWQHGIKLGQGGDTSASGLDWSLAKYVRPHLDDGDAEVVLRRFPYGQIGAGKLKGAAAERRIARILDEIGPRPNPKAESEPEAEPWPEPLADAAFHGLAGEIVRRIEPETEADPAALLFQFLAAVGNVLGSVAHVHVEGDRHPPRLFLVLVGRTSKGRKGTSWGRISAALAEVAPDWAQDRIASGLSSGEGVIYEVRDPVVSHVIDKTGTTREETTDPGVADKRLLLFEGEVAKALRAMERPGNILSSVLRDAWDHGNLRTLIKNNPNRAKGAHVSLIGHVTVDELRRYLDRTEMANGLANRMLFVCCQRSKLLPRGGKPVDLADLVPRLRRVVELAGLRGEVVRTEAAWELWEQEYPRVSDDRPGMLGAIVGRAEAQVLRLATVYALLDGKDVIDRPHLEAALACWRYAEASARFSFGTDLGDPVADEILRALRQRPRDGMTRTELRDLFGRNMASGQIGRALAVLVQGNFVRRAAEKTAGRPVERWHATR